MSWRWNSLRHRIQDHSLRPRTGICKITCIIIQWISRSLDSSLPVAYSMLKSKDFSIFGSFSPNGTRECSSSPHWINEEKSATLSSTMGLFTNSYQMHTDIVTSYIRLRSKEISFSLNVHRRDGIRQQHERVQKKSAPRVSAAFYVWERTRNRDLSRQSDYIQWIVRQRFARRARSRIKISRLPL
jgi:hypothetical protein